MPQMVAMRNQTIAMSSGTRYIQFYGGDWRNVVADVGQVMSSAAVISNVHLTIDIAPGSGKSWTVTLMKNEVATALTFNIADLAVKGQDTSNSVTIAAGDVLCWRAVGNSTPATASFNNWYFEIAPLTPGITQLGGSAFSWNNTTKLASPSNLLGPAAAVGSEYQGYHYVPTAGSFIASYGYQVGAGVTATGFTMLLNLNGVDQDGTGGTVDTRVTWLYTSAKSVSGGTYNLPVVAGDIVYWKATVVGTPGTKTGSISISFQATNTNEYIMGMNGVGGLLAGVNQWTYIMTGTSASPPTVSTSIMQLPVYPTRPVNITKFYVRLTNGPNVGQTRSFTTQKNGSDTSLAFNISGTTQTGNDTANGHKVSLASADTFSVRMGDVTGSSSFSRFTYSLVFEFLGGGKGAGGGSSGGKKGGGGGQNIIQAGGANMLQIGNPGLDIGSTS